MPVNIHGKQYKTVAERVNEIHKEHSGEISITTEIINSDWLDAGVVVMQANVFIHTNGNGKEPAVFTGHAYEQLDSTMINKTSALENCETSAIGRALASAGYGGGEFASADEVANAVAQQSTPTSQRDEKVDAPKPEKPKATVLWSESARERKIAFGKHKGTKWSKLPSDYISWMAKTSKLGTELKEFAGEELAYRDEPSEKVEDKEEVNPRDMVLGALLKTSESMGEDAFVHFCRERVGERSLDELNNKELTKLLDDVESSLSGTESTSYALEKMEGLFDTEEVDDGE